MSIEHVGTRVGPGKAEKRVLLLAADLFEDMELLYPLYRLREEGVLVTVAGVDDAPVKGKKGHGPVRVDTTVDRLAESEFDALVIPGGFAPDTLRRSPTVLALVRSFDDAEKPIAFICHAWLGADLGPDPAGTAGDKCGRNSGRHGQRRGGLGR